MVDSAFHVPGQLQGFLRRSIKQQPLVFVCIIIDVTNFAWPPRPSSSVAGISVFAVMCEFVFVSVVCLHVGFQQQVCY